VKKLAAFIVIAWSLLVASQAFAAGDATAGTHPVRVAFVNTPQVLEQAPQARSARERLEKEFAPRDEKITTEQEQLLKLEDKLSREGPVMSDEKRRKLEREILLQQREVKREREAFTEDLNLRRNEEFAKLQRVVAAAIISIAKAQHFDLILESGVVYASNRVDITQKVIDRLRQQEQAGTENKK